MTKLVLHINSGICKCGHSWDEHHLSVICNKKAWDAIVDFIKTNYPGRTWRDSGFDKEMGYPMYIPGECEHYGFNECGGMMPDKEGNWVEHCHRYVDKDGPLATVDVEY